MHPDALFLRLFPVGFPGPATAGPLVMARSKPSRQYADEGLISHL
jgi:hypothetical protein